MALGTMPTRPALLVRIEDTSGCFGWGEVWANFPPRANIHKAHLIEDVVAKHLQGMSYSDPREVDVALRDQLSVFFLHVGQVQVFEHILAGIDTALWDLSLRSAGASFAEFMSLSNTTAQSYATSINAEDLEDLIPRHARFGQTHFKLKIGFAEHGTASILERATGLCPTGARIMVDSNQSWSLSQAKSALEVLEGFDPYFAEESLRADAPLEDWEELAMSTNIPLAGGENIYGTDNFLAMVGAGMKVLQPDVAKWGGISGALELARVVPDDVLIWPHFMGTAVGQIAALSISAALGPSSVCEVDVNANPLRTELCADDILIRDGQVALPDTAGLVMPPSDAGLKAFAEESH
ncbi:mandelate racemase/muconate lactonizing enzyme family protein [bacterium]|nr:mandelate racemase/muconate lactonizing enzyme family protein [bacterium]